MGIQPTIPEGRAFDVPFAATTKSGQDVEHECIVIEGENRLRVHIRSNPFRLQCFARAAVWSPRDLRWNEVAHIPSGAMATPIGLNARKGWDDATWFDRDFDTLMDKARLVLFGCHRAPSAHADSERCPECQGWGCDEESGCVHADDEKEEA